MDGSYPDCNARNWRLIVDGPHSGAVNMARDEAIALCAAGSVVETTLRIYSFEPAAVTLGRFQGMPSGMRLDAYAGSGVDVVRRPTGGNAILHENDFTYSVVLNNSTALHGVSESVRCFNMIAGAIVESLRSIGVAARQVRHGGETGRGSGWCFDGEHGVDLEWRGRKICGSAQRQYKGALLQHGSLFPGTETGESPASAPAGPGTGGGGARFVTVSEAASQPVAWDDLLKAFVQGFTTALGITLVPGRLSGLEEERARELAENKYSSREWLVKPERQESL